MIKIAICDDELDVAKTTEIILKSEMEKLGFNGNVIAVTDDQNVILELMKNEQIDILFLDINFKNSEINGITLAEELRKINKKFLLIFLTAYSRYMHISFLTKTYDYIIKPINENIVSDLLYRLKSEFEGNNNLMIKFNKNLTLRSNRIYYIEKQGHVANIHTKDNIYSINSVNIEYLLNILPKNFKKCHRAFIVNEDKIVASDKKENTLILEDNISCPFSSLYELKS